MPTRNEDNAAFMPTANDALYSNVNADNLNNYSVKSQTPSAPPRSNSSPYFAASPNLRSLRGSELSSKAASPMSGPPALPRSQLSRERTNSSKKTTTQTTTMVDEDPDPADEIFWYNLHMETLDNFERERLTWKKMIERLQRDMNALREELHLTRARVMRFEPSANGVGMAYTNGSGAAEGKDMDKVFTDDAIIQQAHQKLRELSVVSPDKQVGNPFDRPSPTQLDGVTIKRSAMSRQTSYETAGRPQQQQQGEGMARRVTISDLKAEEISEIAADPGVYSSFCPFHLYKHQPLTTTL